MILLAFAPSDRQQRAAFPSAVSAFFVWRFSPAANAGIIMSTKLTMIELNMSELGRNPAASSDCLESG